jgi:phosphatidylserine/phosphatidylglycerophosphate/cardiolipin synthase-like enzyme
MPGIGRFAFGLSFAGERMRTHQARLGLSLLLAAMAASLQAQAEDHQKHHEISTPCNLSHPPQFTVNLTGARATASFSPGGDGAKLIIRAVAAAHDSILIQAYTFTDRRILAALAKARAHGVDVRVILDKSTTQPYQEHESTASTISAERIPVWIDSTVNIAHNKVIIIDRKDLITGSYNFTYSADYDNAENLLYIRNAPQLVKAYINEWYWRQNCSQPYRRPSN